MIFEHLEAIAKVLKENKPDSEVRIGTDKSIPFEVDSAPFIMISPGTSGASIAETDNADEFSVNIDFGIVDESSSENEDGVLVFSGVNALDVLAGSIREALLGAVDGFYLSQCGFFTYDEQFPLFVGNLSLVFKNEGFL